jgi:hypothetical protein
MKKIKTRNSRAWKLSKKGMFDTVVTIFSILFLVFVFIVFVFLFKMSAKQREGAIDSDSSSLNTELMLKTFLKSPAYSLDNNEPKDLTPSVELTTSLGGTRPTNADLISWTCNSVKDANYKALKASVNNFFDSVYRDDWEMSIIYSNQNIKMKSFGHGTGLGDFIKKTINFGATAGTMALLGSTQGTLGQLKAAKAFFTPIRGEGSASQLIPCQDGKLAAVLFKSKIAYFEVRILK